MNPSSSSTTLRHSYRFQRQPRASKSDSTARYDISKHLRSSFTDIIDSSDMTDKDIIDLVKSQHDMQTIRIRRLERALRERQVLNQQGMLSVLLERYPEPMLLYREQIEQEQWDTWHHQMMDEYKHRFEILKLKYRIRFYELVERMAGERETK